MKRFLSLALALILIFSLASCSDDGTGGSISYALDASPSTLDPQYAGDTPAQIVINNIFEGLVRLSESGEVIPGIAESWEISPDGLTYTFKLKQDTKWKCPNVIKKEFGEEFYNKFNVAPVTAHDFVFAMQRAVSPEINSSLAHRLFAITNATEIYSGKLDSSALGVTAPDDYTLVISLREPCSDMLERFSEGVFMPCNEEFYNAMGGRYGLTYKHILCNGPFYITAWDSSSQLIIRKNSEYVRADDVMPASVIFSFIPELKNIINKLEAQSLGAALLPPDCKTPEGTVVTKENENSVYGFIFNCSDSSLKNANIRKALCFSINRSLFEFDSINGTPQTGFVPKSCSAGSLNYRAAVGSQTPEIVYDKDSASALWQTGLGELAVSKVTLTVLCPESLDSAVRRQLQIWQQAMGISLAITIENASAEEIAKSVSSGDYQIALSGIEAEDESAVDFFASLENGGVFRFSSEEYGMIIDRLLQVEGDSELLGGCFTAENFILQQGICYPLCSRSSRFVTSEEVEGITILNSESTVSFIGAKRYD
ncbi:MAG: peptide ABC transporter substrate-binding protein [Clostridia bacterium]|nr:peptide ABC transporter substrate-binding protein [Clostridia bacterium]